MIHVYVSDRQEPFKFFHPKGSPVGTGLGYRCCDDGRLEIITSYEELGVVVIAMFAPNKWLGAWRQEPEDADQLSPAGRQK